jgi:hypothetical protein
MDMDKGTPAHVEDGVFDREWRDQKFTDKTTQEVAQDRAILEADLTPLQAIKAYPMAIFWSLMASMCVISKFFLFSQTRLCFPWTQFHSNHDRFPSLY